MPTGYTAAIADGVDFNTYAMNCARAFGALVTMRDDPRDAPIPEKFEASTYHVTEIAKVKLRIESLLAMPQLEIERQADAAFADSMNAWRDRGAKRHDLRRKYEAMLTQVEAYVPPSPEHVEYKNFMASQIRQSIDFDCDNRYDDQPKRLAPEDWFVEELQEARRSLAYHEDENRKEIERTESRNRWIAQLRASLQYT